MMNHADVLDLADLYALDALPSDVALDVEAHLTECAECRAAVENAWEVAKLLRQAVPEVDPPPGLRTRLLEIARADVPAPVPVPVQSARGNEPANEPVLEPRAPRGAWAPPRWLSLAALVPLLLVGWLTLQMFSLQEQTRSTELALGRSVQNAHLATEVMGRAVERGGTRVQVLGAETAPSAYGTLYYPRNDTQGVLVVEGLPPLPQDQEYQCWLQSGESRMNVGTLHREENGRSVAIVKAPMALDSADVLRVTNEPRGASSEPHGSPYLWARIKVL